MNCWVLICQDQQVFFFFVFFNEKTNFLQAVYYFKLSKCEEEFISMLVRQTINSSLFIERHKKVTLTLCQSGIKLCTVFYQVLHKSSIRDLFDSIIEQALLTKERKRPTSSKNISFIFIIMSQAMHTPAFLILNVIQRIKRKKKLIFL